MSRPEAVAVAYAEQNFGRKSFDPDGRGYNINVIECGARWCVQLYPARDPATGDVRYIGGGVELELQKSDLAVVKHELTQ
jgi:hypothetical protein